MFYFSPITNEIIFKFTLAAILGLIIGLERELKRKPVGLKTSPIICVISCLITMVSFETAYIAPSSVLGVKISMDPLRLAAQIISGIGFLGAGVILRKDNDSITGLTTAAMIWGAAGIGVAVGVGFYTEAVIGVLLIIISVKIIPFIMSKIGPKSLRDREVLLKIRLKQGANYRHFIKEFEKQNFSIYQLNISGFIDGGNDISMNIGIPYKLTIADIYQLLICFEDVAFVEIKDFS